MKYFYLLAGSIFFLYNTALTSCVTPKQLSYFQEDGTDENKVQLDSIFTQVSNFPVTKGVILTIRVNSTSPDSTKNPFEPIIIPGRPIDPPASKGYLVDDNGDLSLPLVGVIPAAGKTTAQIAALIRTKLQPHLNNPTVTVQYTTRISVIGEVNKPAVFTLNNTIITLPEALGLAGDLTTYARRDNILVIRYAQNKLVYQRIDLTKRGILQSPYYFLQPGDVIYVSPGKARAASVDRTYQVIPILLSSLTVIATILGLALR